MLLAGQITQADVEFEEELISLQKSSQGGRGSNKTTPAMTTPAKKGTDTKAAVKPKQEPVTAKAAVATKIKTEQKVVTVKVIKKNVVPISYAVSGA